MIQKFKGVGIELREKIDHMILESANIDNDKTQIFTDASLNVYVDMHCAYTYYDKNRLVGFLFVFAPTKNEVEINALILPEYRKKGILNVLLKEAVKESLFFGYKKGLLVCNAANEAGRQVMAHWKYPVHHVEYAMKLEISNQKNIPEGFLLEVATKKDIEELSDLSAKIFNTEEDDENSIIKNNVNSADRIQWKFIYKSRTIGICSATPEGGCYSIYGLGIHPDERRKGYARILLDMAANFALENTIQKLFLEVDSENPSALELYRSYGFQETSANYYYEFELNE